MPETKELDIIEASGGHPSIGHLQFKDIKAQDLVNFKPEFGAVFAKYKINKIVTILTPMFGYNTSQPIPPIGGVTFDQAQGYSGQCLVTRIHGKYFNKPFDFGGYTAVTLREKLAQIQSKTCSKLYRPKATYLTTNNPGNYENVVKDPSTGLVTVVRSSNKWLNITDQSDLEFAHADALTVERLDGLDITDDWKYRVTHKIYFECSIVG